MTDNNHPINPPPELLQKWCQQGHNCISELDALKELATKAARWGADQQLEQDAKWLDITALFSSHLTITPSGDALRQVMRPKPPSLKAGAIEVLDELDGLFELPAGHYNTILRALEKLDDSL